MPAKKSEIFLSLDQHVLVSYVQSGGEKNLEFYFDFQHFPFGVNKEVVGIHVLLTRSLFGGGILRRLLLRVSLAKSTSAPLRF
jgi:hypothetical protein